MVIEQEERFLSTQTIFPYLLMLTDSAEGTICIEDEFKKIAIAFIHLANPLEDVHIDDNRPVTHCPSPVRL